MTAQINPREHWQTIRTEHFYVHFTPQTEAVARRAAVSAESAYVQLSQHLHPPRGPIDILVTDGADFSNGSAGVVPSNRIVIYANPTIDQSGLRFTDDPIALVATHELTHVFHLDRTGGIWKPLQLVFGRLPMLFPHSWEPSWLVEGMAVYYESLLTGAGRIAGSEHRMIANAAAIEHLSPRIDQLSLAQPRFPYGTTAYAYGSLFVDFLAREHGDSSIRTFVESGSRQLIPMWLNWPARRAFKRSFTSEYKRWTASLAASAPPNVPPVPGWRDLTRDGARADWPRWVNDSTLVYDGTGGRSSYAAYTLSLQNVERRTQNAEPITVLPKRQKLERRNSPSPNSPLADGSFVYSQIELTSPVELRNDLYRRLPNGKTQRLTHGARLSLPDVRFDGTIVAVQTLPGTTRLARVSLDGRRITPLTTSSLDEMWTEPRWSPDGKHIAAVKWTRGGTASIVVVDTAGQLEQTLIAERAVNATPSWSADGRYVYFSSDRDGTANLYRAAFKSALPDTMMVPDVQRVSSAVTGLFTPQISPSGHLLTSVIFRADGYHIGVAPIDSLHSENAPALSSVAPRTMPAAVSSTAPSSEYQAQRTLLPTSWLPYEEAALTDGAVRLGASVFGQDVVGRHAYQALLFVPTDNSGVTGAVYYKYARLVQPLVEFSAEQDWENRGCITQGASNTCIGDLRRRIRDVTVNFTFQRPRVRTYSFVSVGGGYEFRNYATEPESLMVQLPSLYAATYNFPRVQYSLGWSNVQYPALAISPEDGIAISHTGRYRWRNGDPGSITSSFVASASAYKSLELPGFSKHVIALRAAGGSQDNRGNSYYEVGGVSGGALDVFPGYVLGEGRRTFQVRGFPAASLLGIRAWTGNAEYRAPIKMPGRGFGTLPMFLDRMSLTFFGDAGAAWCPGIYQARPAPSPTLCTPDAVRNAPGFLYTNSTFAGLPVGQIPVIASAGGELNLTAAVLSWDEPYAFRLGYAVPLTGTSYLREPPKPNVYFAVGTSF